MAEALVERAIRDEAGARWRFLEHRQEAPLLPPGTSWMQGAAGIAAFLLRLARVIEYGLGPPSSTGPTSGGPSPAGSAPSTPTEMFSRTCLNCRAEAQRRAAFRVWLARSRRSPPALEAFSRPLG